VNTALPTRVEVEAWLASRAHPPGWAGTLTGLPWEIIHPVCRIAAATRVHPAAALAVAAAYTGDPVVKRTIAQQLGRHDPAPPPAGPNRATRRAQGRNTRLAGNQ
jgi:hypothetical protein